MKRKAVPAPGYLAKKPRYPAIRRLNTTLGEQDMLIDLVEVSLRYFERTFSGQPDEQEFVNEICRSLGMTTSLGTDWINVRSNAHRFSITQCITMIDVFLRNLAYEVRAYKNIPTESWKTRSRGKQLNPLEALTENLPAAEKTRARECPEYHLIQYYRAVRNRAIHPTDQITDEQLVELIKYKGHFESAYGQIPNRYALIDYGDYRLLTRSIKYYANVLNDACDLQSKDVYRYQMREPQFVALVRRHKKSQVSLHQFVNDIAVRYDMQASDAAELQGLFSEFVLSDPTRKVRRRIARRR